MSLFYDFMAPFIAFYIHMITCWILQQQLQTVFIVGFIGFHIKLFVLAAVKCQSENFHEDVKESRFKK